MVISHQFLCTWCMDLFIALQVLVRRSKLVILQFALHYSWSTEAHARRALANVSSLLRPGGIFIGTMPDANIIIEKLREGIFVFNTTPSSYFHWQSIWFTELFGGKWFSMLIQYIGFCHIVLQVFSLSSNLNSLISAFYVFVQYIVECLKKIIKVVDHYLPASCAIDEVAR